MQVGSLLVDREVVLTMIDVDEPLHRPFAVRPVAEHRRGNEVEAQHLTELVGRQLAPVQSGFEVPQRPLAAQRLVDPLGAVVATGDVDEERRVAAPRHAPLHIELAAVEDVQLVGPTGQFIRGHAWPSGSIGLPHHWHGGRPAATIESV